MGRQINKNIALRCDSRRGVRIAPTGMRALGRCVARKLSGAFVVAGIAVAMLGAPASHAATSVVQYTYDAAGNIVAIGRGAAAGVSIAGFAPASGPVGTIVTISGTGFSPTASGNGVSFNGVAAPVTAASTTTLSVTVPSGATTGRIVVTVSGTQATSAQDFAVSVPGMPTIGGFTPAAGAAGTAVTLTGTNFNPSTGATSVKLNQGNATVTSVTPTQVVFLVPPSTGSGKVRVVTGAGSAESAIDFIVPPPSIAVVDIAASTRLVANGATQSLAVYAFNKFGLILFDGNPGDWLSLQFGNFVINPAGAAVSYSIYKPDNTLFTAGSLSAGNQTIHVPPLPAAGTYAVVVRSGTTQVSLDARLETNRFIPGDGSSIATTRGSGQSTRALIAAVAGEQKALMVSTMANAPVGTSLNYEVVSPSGSVIRRGTAYGQGSTDLMRPFALTGTHAVIFTPGSFMTLSSYQIALLAGATLQIDGAATTVNIASAGAGALLNVAGTAGDNLGFAITGVAPDSPPTVGGTFWVYKPDGNLLNSANCSVTGGPCSVNLANLPATGNYGVIFQPWSGGTGTLRAWLSRDLSGSLTVGAPMAVALARPGQNARMTFTGTLGALIAVQVRRIVTAPANQPLIVQVNRPDGTRHGNANAAGSGETLVLPPLPVTGTYTVFIEPDSNTAQGAATSAMEVLLDPGQILAIDAPTLRSTIAVAGASARYTFNGTAGQNLGFGISNLALTNGWNAIFSIYKPDGLALASVSCSGSTGRCGINLVNLPATGTYQVVVRPAYGGVGSVDATLSTDLAGTLVVGSRQPVTLDRPGQNARLTFAGAQGQTLRLAWSGVTIAGANLYVYVYLLHPNGTMLSGASFFNGAVGGIDLPALPVTGAYTIFIDPVFGTKMNATLVLTTR
ncbi:MAG: IPT/TIG domain-containing protein [Betaproteobacteria bacterium]